MEMANSHDSFKLINTENYWANKKKWQKIEK